MKKTLSILIFLLGAMGGYAQFPVGVNAAPKSAQNIGHIYGKIVDSLDHPLPDASVMLLQSKYDSVSKKRKDILYKGLSTKSNGEFSFEELPLFGGLKIRISATGFKGYEQSVTFQMKMPAEGGTAGQSGNPMAGASNVINGFDKDLGDIRLTNDVKQLQAVIVTASKPTLRMDIDKKVYNVEKDIVSQGGTALDVMRNVPSVNVDIDGNVTLRNAAPQIYIEGRPTTLTLDQIPADAIESVEVITNPSAKYDASGGGSGILNIILKKNRKSGYNGNVRVGVNKYGAVNGGGDFNVREGKINLSASAFVNQMRDKTHGTTIRQNLIDTPQTAIQQANYDLNKGAFVFGRVGLDYFASNRNTFSLAGIRVHGSFEPSQVLNINTDSLYSGGISSGYSERMSNTNRQFNASGIQASYKHNFAKEGENLTADFNFFSGKNSNNSLYTTNYYANGQGSAIDNTTLQKVIGEGNNQFMTFQTDYVKPFSTVTKLETGLRASMQKMSNVNDNYFFNDSAKDFIYSPLISSNYNNDNKVYAAYISVTSAIKNFGYQVGLRAESSRYQGNDNYMTEEKNGTLNDTLGHFGNQYPVSLFPSLFLSQKLGGKQELQLSFTRRINRPNFFQLIPFIDYSDSLNIKKGNPNLVPEFTNTVELSYMKTWKGNNSFLGSIYYKYTTNLITSYIDTFYNAIGGKEDLLNTFVNANSSKTMGAELTTINTVTRWLDITANINIYNSKINTNNVNEQVQPALWSWFGKFNSNFRLPGKFKLQITATYQAKTNLPVNSNSGNMGGPPMMTAQSASQGYIKPFYGVDAAVSRSFLKNDAATVSLSFSDLFRSRINDQYSSSEYFIQTYSRLRDPQMIRLNFTYHFGKLDVSLFKRKNLNNNGMQDATQGMQ
ncbi:MAG TPA: TonB-dependent receptor [Puia sp.]|nr:TonB-dependent receptor [Puia sp.]